MENEERKDVEVEFASDFENSNPSDMTSEDSPTSNSVEEADGVVDGERNVDFDRLLKSKRFYLFCKRLFDFFASLFGILVLSPLFLIISLTIFLTSKGGVFFCQTRVGKDGKKFKIIKFRTMIRNAEAKGMQITVGGDNRITKVGKFLRKCKLDELPQLFNVFIGQMSFVGYRPEVPKYVDLYTEYQQNILRIRPGITDLASIEFRNENEILENAENPEAVYIEEIMQKKLDLNLRYMREMGFWYDIGLIFKTFAAILK